MATILLSETFSPVLQCRTLEDNLVQFSVLVAVHDNGCCALQQGDLIFNFLFLFNPLAPEFPFKF